MNLCALWLLVIYVSKCSNVYGASIPDPTNSRFPGGIVYYVMEYDYDATFNSLFKEVLNEIEANSCLQFEEVKGDYNSLETNFLRIANPKKNRECSHQTLSSYLPIEFGYDCLSRRDVLHTMLHALGIPDEVQHTSRDQYLKINWENINPKYVHLFRVARYKSLVDYDPTSVMQFHSSAFSKNGQDTIEMKLPGMTINPSQHLSILDKMKLRVKFGHECNNRKAKNVIDTCRKAMGSKAENNGLESEGTSENIENGDSTSDENLVDHVEEQSSDSSNAIDNGISSNEDLSTSNNLDESSRVSDSENSGTGDDNKPDSLSDSTDQSASDNSRDDSKEMSDVVQTVTSDNSEQDKELNNFKDDASENSVTSDNKESENLSDTTDQSASDNSRDDSKEMNGVDQKPINEASESSANIGESGKETSDSDISLQAVGSSNENSIDDKSSNKLSAGNDKMTSDNLSNEDASSNNESLGSEDEPVKNKGRSMTDPKRNSTQ